MTKAQQVQAIAKSDLSPFAKRMALRAIGVEAEYQPHQGKREIERRLKRMSKTQQAA
jgi:hypothetical protein